MEGLPDKVPCDFRKREVGSWEDLSEKKGTPIEKLLCVLSSVPRDSVYSLV